MNDIEIFVLEQVASAASDGVPTKLEQGDLDTTLEELGVDSLGRVELFQLLKTDPSMPITENQFNAACSSAEIVQEIQLGRRTHKRRPEQITVNS